ncbi:hypothetical protein CC1G_06043 [Coprinopsis cinerea okayama7|uniref:Uncharacterized protein n=1 Tax=Coprinopsis cinerea (strain Okayama-7 / 130 / ATCC MYA-4618 / FGSC 9003) TaxID=240176 RepID=A8N4G6_COPC7|nr:hypothetical protein CC1G_06043 [Coprinopsis cinerea okayama7\|eukprot:XP_001829834.1 hypothetical protein CC1G_06043 [Coprinopsis cinerea okayama7\
MSILSKSFALFLLVSSIVVSVEGNPIPTKLIGYRVVPKKVAEAYAKNGNKLDFSIPANGQQLGPGVYASPGPGEWEGDMQCFIQANGVEWDRVPKVWIHQFAIDSIDNGKAVCGSRLFWNENRYHREDYIKRRGATPANTVLFSHIETDKNKIPDPKKDKVQMLIPKAVGENPKLDIRIYCFPPGDQQIPTKLAAWETWGIKDYRTECGSEGGSSSRTPSPSGSGNRKSTPPPKAGSPKPGSPKPASPNSASPKHASSKPGSKPPSPGPGKRVKRDLSSLDLERRALQRLS